MSERDTAIATPGDIATALALLTRLPVPASGDSRGARAAWAYPLAGAAVGALAVLAGLTAGGVGLPDQLVAGLTLLVLIAATGAMHEDGLADTADGLWGGWTRERRLEIMRDSRIGTYGVIALVISLGLRWVALGAIAGAGGLTGALICATILSRAPMVVLMHALPNARTDGLSAGTGRPALNTALLACGIALTAAFAAVGWHVLPLMLLLLATTLFICVIALRKIGGQSGDILGATQQVSEITILCYLAAWGT